MLDKGSRAWNGGRAWIDGASEEVVEAYSRQSEEDLDNFFKCRREEIAEGGILFMLMGGRPNSQPPRNQLEDADSKAKHPFTTSMDQAWQDILNEVPSLNTFSPNILLIVHYMDSKNENVRCTTTSKNNIF